MNWICVFALLILLQLHLPPCSEAAFSVSLELQGGDCSDQLTLICRHSDAITPPQWIHNGTLESGVILGTAFPGAMYTVETRTVHTTTITGIDNVRALDEHLIQCAYRVLGNLTKSNAVKYSFIPPDYQPALSLLNSTADFSERLATFNYSYQNSCSLYPRCAPYFSVEHTVSPQSVVSNTSSGCSVEYTILNLIRCVSYQSTATPLLGNQSGNTVVVGTTVMLSPSQFNITSVSIGADNDHINVTYTEYEPDCPVYPTERYTVDVDGVQVADLTADEVQSLAINHVNGAVTLSLNLTQRLPENAVTVNMTKFNTVPTNRSDDTGNIVTEMVTWGTSAVFDLQMSPPGSGSPPARAAMYDKVAIAVGVSAAVIAVIVAVVAGVCGCCTWRNRKMKQLSGGYHNQMMTVNLRAEGPADTSPGSDDETPTDNHGWVEGAGRRLPMPPEEEEEGGTEQPSQKYAELVFTSNRPPPAPKNEMVHVTYTEVKVL